MANSSKSVSSDINFEKFIEVAKIIAKVDKCQSNIADDEKVSSIAAEWARAFVNEEIKLSKKNIDLFQKVQKIFESLANTYENLKKPDVCQNYNLAAMNIQYAITNNYSANVFSDINFEKFIEIAKIIAKVDKCQSNIADGERNCFELKDFDLYMFTGVFKNPFQN